MVGAEGIIFIKTFILLIYQGPRNRNSYWECNLDLFFHFSLSQQDSLLTEWGNNPACSTWTPELFKKLKYKIGH